MLWLVLLFVVAPLVELFVIIQVATVIGGWQTIALIIVESMIGAWLLKRQGLSTLDRITRAVNEGRVPSRELADGFLLLVAGSFMLAPGFISDVLAYLLILPPTRVPFRKLLLRRIRSGSTGRFFQYASSDGTRRFVGTFTAGGVVDTTGSAHRSDPPAGELGP